MIWVTSLLITVNLSMPMERKLAAIMFTDIAGYTALSAKDEEKASGMEKEFAEKFFSYPLPKTILKEYNKLNKDKN